MIDSSVQEPTIAALVVRRLIETAEQAGIRREDLLDAAGLRFETLTDNFARVPRSRVERVCALAITPPGDRALGLHWAERLTELTFNPLSYILVHAGSLRQGLELALEYQKFFSDEPFCELIEQGDEATLRLADWSFRSLQVVRFMAEACAGGFSFLIHCYHPQARFERVCFRHGAPEYCAEYVRIFGRDVHFDQPFNDLVFERALLDAPAPHADSEIRRALMAVVEQRLLRLADLSPYVLRVRDLLIRRLPARINMSTAARVLGLGERSLRRLLAAEGKSYREIQHGVLESFAEHLLRTKRVTIQEAAHQMGFSDATAFHRAFKRWTGVTPSEFSERKG